MTTAEADRCFSTLKEVNMFLRNTVSQERLIAEATLSREKKLVTEMTDFNQTLIDKISNLKERQAKFLYKSCCATSGYMLWFGIWH